jgi:hypothetical protein
MLACWSLELLLIAQMLTRYHGLCCFFHYGAAIPSWQY